MDVGVACVVLERFVQLLAQTRVGEHALELGRVLEAAHLLNAQRL
jgi:hypothetical protein